MKHVFIIVMVSVIMIGMIVPNAYAQTQSTTLVLDPFSSSANLGETITFSGKLTSNGNGVSGAIVNIMDEDLLDTSDKLISTTTNSNGHFSVNWTVKNTEAGDRQFLSLAADLLGGIGFATQANSVYNLMEADTVEIYAKFSGNDQYSKSNTCLSKIVNDKSKIDCENNILKIQGEDSFKNFIMSAVMSEIGADIIGTDSFDSILSGQNDSIDMMSLEDLLLEQLQIEIGDLENIDLTMEQMLEILDDPSLSKMYGTVTPIPVTPIPVTPVIPNYFSTHHDSNDLFSIDIPNNWDLESHEGGVIFYDDSDSWNAFVLITYIENSHMGSKPFPMILDELEKQERDYCTYSTFEQSGEICYNYNKLSAEVIDDAVLVVQSHTNQYDSLNPHESEMISFTYWIIDGNNHWELYGVVDQSYKDPYFDIIGESLQSFTIIEQTSSEFQNNFGATIEFDQKVYTTVDTVYITIVAPDYNTPNLIDVIGSQPTNRITISTSMDSMDYFTLVETGRDTGIFAGEIMLKDIFSTNKNGLLTSPDDQISILFSTSYFDVIGTAMVSWNIGEIQWLDSNYSINDNGKVMVIDPDLNFNTFRDSVSVNVYSDSDPSGIGITLTETGDTSGIFEGNVPFTTSRSGVGLFVDGGDTITAVYADYTLPTPYTISDSVDITNTSQIKINPSTPVAPTESDVTVNLNKLSYSTGDIIQVSGTIFNPNMNEYIAIEILKPGVGLADVDDYLNLNSQGEFSTSFRTDGINWDKSGTYTIRITGDSFNEFNKNIIFTKTNSVTPTIPSTEWKTTPELTAGVFKTEVYSNKEYYIVNDKIILNGQTPSKITPVKIRIDDPNGNLVKLLQIPENGQNTFSTSLKIEKLWFTQSGEYTINAWTSSAEPDKDSLKIIISIPGSDNYEQTQQITQLEAEKESQENAEQEAKIAQLESEKESQQEKIAQLEAEKQEAKIAQLEAEKESQETKIAQLEAEQNGGGCLIATASYGSELAPQVQQLRELRDNQLLNTESGTAFMGMFNDVYYSFSPIIADYERENPLFKEAVKIAITPMISSLSLMENANSESEVLGMGLSVIILNIGMYLGLPAVVIIGIRKIK